MRVYSFLAVATTALGMDPSAGLLMAGPQEGGFSIGTSNSYEGRYGNPMFWSLQEIVRGAGPPKEQAFWTRGILTIRGLCVDGGFSSDCLELSGHAAPEIAEVFAFQAPLRIGDEARIIGVYTDTRVYSDSERPLPRNPGRVEMHADERNPHPPGEGLVFWSFESGPRLERRAGASGGLALQELVASPERYKGETVTVAGRFRGYNLFQDLPLASRRKKRDWVLREGSSSIWVTGMPPHGDGWNLNPSSRADAIWNVEVEGRVEHQGTVVFLVGRRVRLLGREHGLGQDQ